MPVTVKCRCGKASMRFDKMNPGDIETFEYPRQLKILRMEDLQKSRKNRPRKPSPFRKRNQLPPKAKSKFLIPGRKNEKRTDL